MNKEKRKKKIEKKLINKMLLSIVYLIVITILFVCSYSVFKQKQDIVPWDEVENTSQYSYINVSKMSEKFAYFEDTKKEIHFVIEEEETGAWHTYLIAINESDYDKFKSIIDYTYERTDKKPKVKKVYGYPVIINDELKKLAIENIKNFIPADNEVVINEENFTDYLTNSYLDITIEKQDNFDMILFILLLLLGVMVIVFVVTIFSKDTIIESVDKQLKEKKKKLKDKKD